MTLSNSLCFDKAISLESIDGYWISLLDNSVILLVFAAFKSRCSDAKPVAIVVMSQLLISIDE
ncbi:hypothetical protein AB6E16_17230 [Vibrio atlanticus]|uniref:hypothetical protein n=1 Tax=Vibrio atlanticus TaxID=693153 RepID=UPI0035545405